MNITFKQFTKEDIPKLLSWIKSPEFLQQWCGTTFQYPLDEAQLEKYIQGSEQIPELRRIYKAADTENGLHIGNVTLELVNKIPNAAAVTCVIIGEEEYRGKGIGKFMVHESLKTAFNELNYESVYLNVYSFNKAAINCYKSAGFSIASQNETDYCGRKATNYMMMIRKDEFY